MIFQIADSNFHAVRPVSVGTGFKRRSFVNYFHTVGENLVLHNSVFAPPIHQTRPPLMHRLVRELTPPLLIKCLKKLKNRNRPMCAV